MFCVTLTELDGAAYPRVTKIRFSSSMRRVKALATAWYAEHQDSLPSFLVEIWDGKYNEQESAFELGQDFDEFMWNQVDWDRYNSGLSPSEVFTLMEPY